jgi:DNA-3-methyladenine glycosylase
VTSGRITDRGWFERHPVRVAFDLIGTVLRVTRDGATVTGRVVETEAYAGPLDLASHSSRMESARKKLSHTPGTLYMYRSYGIHTMLNIVAHVPGGTGGVLIRALEPIDGIDTMVERRRGTSRSLATGPGVLTQSFGLRLTDLGLDLLTSDEIELEYRTEPVLVSASERIGISRSVSAPWRFFATGNRYVSAHRRGIPVTVDDLDTTIPTEGTIIV